MIVIVLSLATPASTGAAVDSKPSGSEASKPKPSRGQGRQASRSHCPYAQLGLNYYRARYVHWTTQRGASIPDWRKPRNCADARYLANVWAKRSTASRQRTEYWLEHRFDAVVEKLNRGLAGTPMAGTGESLEKHGRRYGVSPYFMAAVAATESSLGRAACGPGGYNAWGLGNCGSAWSVPAFSSWDEAYAYYAHFLTRWSGHSTPYSFRGYAACDECWGRKVSEWMGRLFGVPARTSYP